VLPLLGKVSFVGAKLTFRSGGNIRVQKNGLRNLVVSTQGRILGRSPSRAGLGGWGGVGSPRETRRLGPRGLGLGGEGIGCLYFLCCIRCMCSMRSRPSSICVCIELADSELYTPLVSQETRSRTFDDPCVARMQYSPSSLHLSICPIKFQFEIQ